MRTLNFDAAGERCLCADYLQQHCGVFLYNAVGVGRFIFPIQTSRHEAAHQSELEYLNIHVFNLNIYMYVYLTGLVVDTRCFCGCLRLPCGRSGLCGPL